MTSLARLNRPWLHFILLGALLYLLQNLLLPTPKPVVGPLGEARVRALLEQWFIATGRPASEAERARLLAAELDRDMLFQRGLELELHLRDGVIYQRLLRNMRFLGLDDGKSDAEVYRMALDMRLHLGDEVIKRRMIQLVEQLLLRDNPPRAPVAAELEAAFRERRDELRRPPRYSIAHIYFNRERQGEVAPSVARIQREGLDPEAAQALGSPFLPGYRFVRRSPEQLARHFGAAFVRNLQQSEPEAGEWIGPLASVYGQHYVWVEAVEPARDATLDEVRRQLRRDLAARARARALRESIDALREHYEFEHYEFEHYEFEHDEVGQYEVERHEVMP